MKQITASATHRAPFTRRTLRPRALRPNATATVVESMEQGLFGVRCAGMTRTAQRAASCLLEPAPGDLVACVEVAGDGLWITAVLRRASAESPLTLHAPGPMRIEASTLELGAPAIALEGEHIKVRATRLQVASDEAELTGGRLKVLGATLKVIGASLSTVFDRVAHFSKYHLRTTEGLDRVHAAQIEQQASQLMRLSSENTLINGEQLVKARGAQIHFG